jgi:hypothetical protein
VGDDDVVGRAALLLGDPGEHPPEHRRQQRLRRPRLPGDEHRDGVADPALELAGDAVGLGDGAANAGVADRERAVLLEGDHGRDRCRPGAERHHLGLLPRPHHGGRGPRRPEIDPHAVAHAAKRRAATATLPRVTVFAAPSALALPSARCRPGG